MAASLGRAFVKIMCIGRLLAALEHEMHHRAADHAARAALDDPEQKVLEAVVCVVVMMIVGRYIVLFAGSQMRFVLIGHVAFLAKKKARIL